MPTETEEPSAIAASAAAAAAAVLQDHAAIASSSRGYAIAPEDKQRLLSLVSEGKESGKTMRCCNTNCLKDDVDCRHICAVGGAYACGMCRGTNVDGTDLDEVKTLIVCLGCDKKLTNRDDTTDKTSKKKRPSNKEANQLQKQKMEAWVKNLTTEHVQLTSDENDVQKLGGVDWSKIGVDIRKRFLRINEIVMPNDKRKKDDLGKLVANHMKAQGYRNSLTAEHRKKSKAKTKPDCLMEDGTLYRIANTIIEKKAAFIETKNAHDQGDQDTRRAKQMAWEVLSNHYSSGTKSLDKLSPLPKDKLLGHGIPSNISASTHCDTLDLDEFQECVSYLLAHYREARNDQTKSGYHHDFSDCVKGKKWLLYFYYVLVELGDRDLSNCAYPTLNDDVMRTSDKPQQKLKDSLRTIRRSPTSERSMSASPTMMSLSLRNRKQAAVNATAYAAASIESKNEELRKNEGFDRMIMMKDKEERTALKYTALKEKRKCCKTKIDSGNATKRDLDAINAMLLSLKKKRRKYEKEYERLKKDIGYDSPDVSDVSDSDDGDSVAGNDKAMNPANNGEASSLASKEEEEEEEEEEENNDILA